MQLLDIAVDKLREHKVFLEHSINRIFLFYEKEKYNILDCIYIYDDDGNGKLQRSVNMIRTNTPLCRIRSSTTTPHGISYQYLCIYGTYS